MFENKKLLTNLIIITSVCLSIFFLANAYGAFNRNDENKPVATITVDGTGEYFAIPDTALFTFTVEKDAITQKQAKDAGSEVMNNILAKLKKDYDMDDKYLKTINFSLNPKYEWQQQTIYCVRAPCPQPDGKNVAVGYTFNQTVSVKIKDIDLAGEVAGKLTEWGATNVSGPEFTLANEDEARNKARTDAIGDAKSKARTLSAQLGVRLVKIQNFSENNGGGIYPMYGGATMMRDGAMEKSIIPEIPMGENKYTSNVSITYEIR